MTQGSSSHDGVTPLQAIKAILRSFVGIGSTAGPEADITRLSMRQIIAFGLLGATLFVMSVILLVYFVTR